MSCLYRALSAFHQGIATEQMRHLICNFLSSDPMLGGERASKVIPWETKKTLPQYIQIMKNQNQWGGAIEIKAYCDYFKKNVKVISIPNQRTIEFIAEGGNPNDWITISWNGYHYEPVGQGNNTITSDKSFTNQQPQRPQLPQRSQRSIQQPHRLPQGLPRGLRQQQRPVKKQVITGYTHQDYRNVTRCQCRHCRIRYGQY